MSTHLQKKFKILLIGDDCIDEYQYGTVDRISPEAPVPVFSYLYSEIRLGMGSNVRNNLEALGCDVTFISNCRSKKIRLVDRKTRQHLMRTDQDDYSKEPVIYNGDMSAIDAVVISDYDKGNVSYETIQHILKRYLGPVYVDTKKTDLARLEGCFVKVNESERNKVTSVNANLITTLGNKGAIYQNIVYPTQNVEVSDVCGAGDTFLAALVYFHLNTGDIRVAIEQANKASSITVQHLGTYAPTLKEIL